MKRFFCAIVLVVASASSIRADLVVTGEDLNWNLTSQPTQTFTAGVFSTTGTDTLYAWNLGLAISRLSGTGEVDFTSATIPSSNYLFGNPSNGLGLAPPFSGPSTSISGIGDSLDPSGPGVVVPTAGASLLATTLSATAGTNGVFQISVVPLQSDLVNGSYWYSGDFTTQQTFANFGTNGQTVIGTLTVTSAVSAVPEPHSALLLIGGGLGLLLYRRRR